MLFHAILPATWDALDEQIIVVVVWCLQCFDAVGWAAGRASGL